MISLSLKDDLCQFQALNPLIFKGRGPEQEGDPRPIFYRFCIPFCGNIS